MLVISSVSKDMSRHDVSDNKAATALRMIGYMTIDGGFVLDDALDLAAKATGLDLAVVKKAWKKHRIEENRLKGGPSG